MFWYSWPSWVTELLGGAALSALLFAILFWGLKLTKLPAILIATVGGVAISFGYEFFLDPNTTISHRPMVDIGQRAVGQVIGLNLIAAFIKDKKGA